MATVTIKKAVPSKKPLKPTSREVKPLKPSSRPTEAERRGLKPLKPTSRELKPLKPSSREKLPLKPVSETRNLRSLKTINANRPMNFSNRGFLTKSPHGPFEWYPLGFFDTPGRHWVKIGGTWVYYYVPDCTPDTQREFFVGIHGAGELSHYVGARSNIKDWEDGGWADDHGLILIAPVFGFIYPEQSPFLQWPELPFDSSGIWPQGGKDTIGLRYIYETFWPINFFDYPNYRKPAHPPQPASSTYYEDSHQYHKYYNFLKDHGISTGTNFEHMYIEPNHPSIDNDFMFVHSFQYLLNDNNFYRSDQLLNQIIDSFASFFPDVDSSRFSLYGYSGGGQFVSRYMMLYPERLKRIAVGGGGSYMFPLFEANFPHGLSCHLYDDTGPLNLLGNEYDGGENLEGLKSFFGKEEIDLIPKKWCSDIVGLRYNDWVDKLIELFKKHIFLFVGEDDTEILGKDYLEWQGINRLDRSHSLYIQWVQLYAKFKERGLLPDNSRFKVHWRPVECGHAKAQGNTISELRKEWFNYSTEDVFY